MMTTAATSDAWVFGYGSLMWRPGFAFAERRPARLEGRRRAFCIYSVHHRGTPERRGLVLGLARGGSVQGAAFRVRACDWPEVYAYLKEREQPTETYVEALVEPRLDDGRTVQALAFLSDETHPQWAGDLPVETQAQLIAHGVGLSGRNIDYLRDLVAHLAEAGVDDDLMAHILARADEIAREAETSRLSGVGSPTEAAERPPQSPPQAAP